MRIQRLVARSSSDIVALMVLARQTNVHNLMTLAADKIQHAGVSPDAIREATEPLVRAMLFANAASLTEPVAGTSGFTENFSAQGPLDREGRFLRELDLKTRLLRYPVSYLIYSKQYDELPAPAREYIYRRIREVLTGQDKSPIFAQVAGSTVPRFFRSSRRRSEWRRNRRGALRAVEDFCHFGMIGLAQVAFSRKLSCVSRWCPGYNQACSIAGDGDESGLRAGPPPVI